MKINEIIKHLESQGTWVNWDQTRDIVYFGETDKEITKVGTCWVMTNNVIKQAIDKGINFIITHENPFYHMTTSPNQIAKASIDAKKKLLQEHDITVYRCHDVWDKIPHVGVADVWARKIGYDFKRDTASYLQHASLIEPTTVNDLALRVAKALKEDGEDGVYVFGDTTKKVYEIGMGTGAATDIFGMLKEKCDVCIVADDGINNWYQAQYSVDNDLPLIVVNHSGCEIAGLKEMAKYLSEIFKDVSIEYLDEGYRISYYKV